MEVMDSRRQQAENLNQNILGAKLEMLSQKLQADFEDMSAPSCKERYRDFTAKLQDRWKNRGTENADCINTGFFLLDKTIKGFRPGQLIVLGARPRMGKSAFMGCVAMHSAMHHIPVMVMSVEMSFDDMASRMVSSQGILADNLASGDLNIREWATMDKIMQPMVDHISLDDPGTLTLPALRAKVKAWRLKNPGTLSMVMVDLMAPRTEPRR